MARGRPRFRILDLINLAAAWAYPWDEPSVHV